MAILGTRGIPARYGGFETFAERLAIGLVERGHAVTVYAETDCGQMADRSHQGVRVRFRRRPRWGPAATLAYDSACLWDARQGFDLVYMLGYGAAWACWWPRLRGTPVWVNVDGLEWARSKWSWLGRCYLRAMEWVVTWTASRLIADSQVIAGRFRRIYRRRVAIDCIAYGADLAVPGSVSTEQLSALALEPGRYHLVVARPEPENHLLEIIAGHRLHGGDWPLVVVGDVAGATPYQRQLLAQGDGRVRFLGAIYESARLQALRLHAASYVHGHSVGGTNPSLLEALACGNWVIAHDNPFNREVARDAANYFQTADELARCLAEREAEKPSSVAERGRRAREIIARYYTWRSIIEAYEALMQRQLADPRLGT